LRIRAAQPLSNAAPKCLFFENGTVAERWGRCIEAEVWAEARDAQRSLESALQSSADGLEASEEEMVCGGTHGYFYDV